jgi:two-component system, NtrC family, response regulator HydG
MSAPPGDVQDGGADASTALRSPAAGPELAGAWKLVVVQGRDAGATFTLDASQPARILIGTSPACDLRLSDPTVSRRHVSLEIAPRGLLLTDLDSTNGTRVSAMPVVAAYVGAGALVQIGDTTVRIEPDASTSQALDESMRLGRMIGGSAEMRRLYPMCRRIAASGVPVVLEGETGTGKEVLAEALHEASPRAAGPFVVFDCTAVPPNLIESALFGHERGAFTGAVSSKRGVFEEASGGTLLIDEIGELDVMLQPKLLRAIERGEVQRVGSNQWTRTDVRVLAATRRDLDREVQAGRFRDDLFYRLAVARIELPPLRQRRGDVPLLARHFWRELGGEEGALPSQLLARLEDYAWPGNIRELQHALARYLALGELDLRDRPAESSRLSRGDGDAIDRALALDLPLARARQLVVDEFERRYVQRVLDRYGGNVVRAASASGIARRYFQILRARHR